MSDESRRWRLEDTGDGPASPKRTKQKSLAWTHHCGSTTTRQPTARRPAVQSHASGPDFDAEANSPPVATAATARAFGWQRDDLLAIARTSIESAFCDDDRRSALLAELDAVAAGEEARA